MFQKTNDIFSQNYNKEDYFDNGRSVASKFPQLERDLPEFKSKEDKEFPLSLPAHNMKLPDNIRLYVTLKKSIESNIEYKKMILMISCKLLNMLMSK